MNVVPIYSMPFYMAFLLFIIFSVMGWCAEVIYVGILSEHKFVNRGFLYGPLCPIYGFGGAVILLLPPQLYSTWIPLFFASMVLCTLVEYFISWLLEKMFHTLWWDYSHYKFNIKGRVCLVNSVLFGLFGVAAVHFIIPYIMKGLHLFSDKALEYTAHGIAIVLTCDILFTIRRLVDFNTTLEKLRSLEENLKDNYGHEEWFKNSSFSEMLVSVKNRARIEKEKFSISLLSRIEKLPMQHKSAEKLLAKFPTSRSEEYKNGLNFIKQRMGENKKKGNSEK